VPKKPRQKALPGLEDRGIAEIERAAHAYVDARDARMSMGEEEQRRHTKLVAVMHKHQKKTYVHRDGGEVIDIRLTVKDPEEKAKVRIKSADEYEEPKTEPEEGEPEEVEEPEVEMEIEGGDEAGIE
jgi:hypothetical protein